MKVFRYISFVMLLLVLSCVKEEFPDGAMVATMPYSISVTASNTQLGANGNVSTTVNIVAENITWELTGLPQWLTVSQLKGTGSATLKVTATEHKSGDDNRVATFSIKSTTPRYEFSRNITITQGTATKYVNSAGTLTLAAKEATTDVAVESNYNWTAECDSPWVKLVKTDNANLQVTVSENTSSTRTATVMFKAADSTSAIATIIITQSEAGVTGSTANVAFGPDGGTKTVDINAEVSWSAYTSATSWISVSPESGEGGEHSLSITALANNSTTPRSGYVYVMIGTVQKLAIPVSQEALSFHVNGTLQSFAANGTMTQKMQVVSNKSWEVQSCPTWLTVSPSSGGNGTSEISVTAAENRSLNSRSGTLRIGVKGLNLYKEFTVTQNSIVTDFDQTMLEFGWEEEEKDLKIELPNSWSASVSEDWFSMSQYSGNGGETVVVSVKTNDSDDPRTGTVTFVTEGRTFSFSVVQQGQYLKINSTAGEVPAMGNSINLSISTTVGAVESIEYDGTSKDWLSFKKNGNGSYTLVAAYNPSIKNRTARFVVKPTMSTTNAACTAGVKFNVTQKGRALSTSTDEIVVFMDGGTSSTYSIIADGGYTISKPETDDWYTLKHDSVSRTFCIDVTENSDGVGRESQITMSLTGLPLGEELSSVIKVKQIDIYNGHDYVDLGLPSGIMWATCNVGANVPEGYGDYYAWGEVEPKDEYSWETYKWCNGSYNTMIKYCTNSSFGTVDNKTVLDPEDDVAHVKWGGSWRMSTKAEQDELRNNCTWTWTIQNGVNGYKVTGSNGNSIFLPAAGYRNGADVLYGGYYGYYWSSSLNEGSSNGSYLLRFANGSLGWNNNNRYGGRSVRPVCGEWRKYTVIVSCAGNGCVTIKDKEGTSAEFETGSTVTVVATPDDGYRFEGWYLNAGTGTNCVSSDNPYTFTVTEDVQLIARFVAGEQANNLHNGHEYVDLGLPSGTKWATCNVGASRPEEYGNYYAWGELKVKSSYTSANSSTYNKSMSDISGNATYDVARATWSGNWRMPTSTELQELINNCTWTNTTLNGVEGRQVTGRNGNSIFLPYAGYKYSTSISHKEDYGIYWSSTPNGNQGAKHLDFNSGTKQLDRFGLNRYDGLTIRPVCNVSVSGTKYTISVKSEGNGRVEVEGYNTESAQIEIGSTVTVVATPDNGYRFEGWYLNAGTGTNCVSSDNPYTFTVTEDVQLIARFVAGGQANNLHNGHEYVDLGLPSGTKWATCNVGAATPEGYGGYYAWGETEEKEDYSWETYKWCDGSQTTLTKYCTSSSWGTVDNKTVLDLEDDVAHIKWGGSWRMPSLNEMKELYNNCNWAVINQNGTKCYKVTSRINGDSILLPLGGRYFEKRIIDKEVDAQLSTNTLSPTYSHNIYCPDLSTGDLDWDRDLRSYGFSVRPVCNLSVSGTKYTISVKSEGNGRVEVEGYNTESAQIEIGSTVTVVATPDNGYRFEGWYLNAGTGTNCVSSDNSYTFTVTEDVQLIARFVAGGQANNLHNGHEYVDLGLPSGTKWATCNVGAATPEEYGGYYAWGETEEKEDYSWETYKWCDGSQTTLTKYCTSSSWGTVDNKTVLDLEDDVAHVKWGGSWRMPTDTEQDELRDKCTWTWITHNGVVGRKVTGPNGKSIFLPAAGSYYGVEIKSVGDFGGYLASTFFSAYNYCAYQFIFNINSINWNRDSYRCHGLTVRPVYK